MTYSRRVTKTNNNKHISWIIGYTTREHMLLDLDDTSLTKVYSLVNQIMKDYPDIGDCIIMQSSYEKLRHIIKYSPRHGLMVLKAGTSFHAIFNNTMPYNKICEIMECLAVLQVLEKDYAHIRKFRGDMTLRVNGATLTGQDKPAPKFVAWIRNSHTKKKGKGIEKYLNFIHYANCL